MSAFVSGTNPRFADGYPPLPFPEDLAAPSGESGQIQLDGIATSVSLFHGWSANEADWHLFFNVDDQISSRLRAHLAARGVSVSLLEVDSLYGEIMSLDAWSTPALWSDKYYAADFAPAFRLAKAGVEHVAWEFAKQALDNTGDGHDFGAYSRLVSDRGRVYVQGPFVNDAEYGTKPEIHPLESVAFAMNACGLTLAMKSNATGWPTTEVHWRVAYFGNSSFHRISGESYQKKERTITWLLDLPTDAHSSRVGRRSIQIEEKPQQLWDGKNGNWYSGRGWKTIAPYELVIDPRDARTKLKVSATMLFPTKAGGIRVTDYIVRVTGVSR